MITYKFLPSILFLCIMLSSCSQSQEKQKLDAFHGIENNDNVEKYAQLEFIEDFFDFGNVKQGEVVSYTFKFTNTGNVPLIVMTIASDCGCTKSKVSSDIVNPNDEATIEVVFDSSGWRGVQFKSVTMRTNGKIKSKSVTIKANVVI